MSDLNGYQPRLKTSYDEEIRVRVCKRDGCGQEVDR